MKKKKHSEKTITVKVGRQNEDRSAEIDRKSDFGGSVNTTEEKDVSNDRDHVLTNTNDKEYKAPEVPKLEPFVKEIFYSFKWNDLGLDLLFIVFSNFISTEFFSEKGLFEKLETWQTLAMYCAVVLTLPYFFGYLYVRNSAYFSKTVMKIQLWVFIIITLMILVNLVRLTLRTPGIENPTHDKDGFFAVFAMFMLVLGPMMCLAGSANAYSEFSRTKNDDFSFDSDRFASTGAFFMIVLAIAFMIYFIGLFPDEQSGMAAIAGLFLGPLAAAIVFGIIMGIFMLLDKIGIYKYLVMTARTTFPFFITIILVFWSGVSLHLMQDDFGNRFGKISPGAMIFSVMISGLIPFRIITLLNPPWRLTKILIGIGTLTYFFYRLTKLVY